MTDHTLYDPHNRDALIEPMRKLQAGYERAIAEDPAYIANPGLTADAIRLKATGLYVEFKPVIDELGAIHSGQLLGQLEDFADRNNRTLEIPTKTVEVVNGFINSLDLCNRGWNSWKENDGSRESFLTLPRDSGIHGSYRQHFSSFGELADRWRSAKLAIFRNQEARQNVKNADSLWAYERDIGDRYDNNYHWAIEKRVKQIAKATADYVVADIKAALEPYASVYQNMTNSSAAAQAIEVTEQISDQGVKAFHQLLENMAKGDRLDGHGYLSMAQYVMAEHGARPTSEARPVEPLALPQRTGTVSDTPDEPRASELLATRGGRRAIRELSTGVLQTMKSHREFAHGIKGIYAKPEGTKSAQAFTRRLTKQGKSAAKIGTAGIAAASMSRKIRREHSPQSTLVHS